MNTEVKTTIGKSNEVGDERLSDSYIDEKGNVVFADEAVDTEVNIKKLQEIEAEYNKTGKPVIEIDKADTSILEGKMQNYVDEVPDVPKTAAGGSGGSRNSGEKNVAKDSGDEGKVPDQEVDTLQNYKNNKEQTDEQQLQENRDEKINEVPEKGSLIKNESVARGAKIAGNAAKNALKGSIQAGASVLSVLIVSAIAVDEISKQGGSMASWARTTQLIIGGNQSLYNSMFSQTKSQVNNALNQKAKGGDDSSLPLTSLQREQTISLVNSMMENGVRPQDFLKAVNREMGLKIEMPQMKGM